MKKGKTYVFKIRIDRSEYNYKTGEIIYSVVKSSTKFHAKVKYINRHTGSEFPPYTILEIIETDAFFMRDYS